MAQRIGDQATVGATALAEPLKRESEHEARSLSQLMPAEADTAGHQLLVVWMIGFA
jgi:hypothetical protein